MSAPLPFAVHYEVDSLYTALVDELTQRIGGQYAADRAQDEATIARWRIEDVVRDVLAAYPAPATTEEE